MLWTGSQWKAVHCDWIAVSSSVLHERFETWQRQGIWENILRALAGFYARRRSVCWQWQAMDSKSVPAPLDVEATGRNPTDRDKRGTKVHILVDQHRAPLAIHLTGEHQHDKWSVDDLLADLGRGDAPDQRAAFLPGQRL